MANILLPFTMVKFYDSVPGRKVIASLVHRFAKRASSRSM